MILRNCKSQHVNQNNIGSQMQKCSVFNGLSNDDINYLMQGSVPKTIPTDQLIFSEHDCVSHYYFIVSGRVNMFHYSPTGNEIIHLTRETDQLLLDPCIFLTLLDIRSMHEPLPRWSCMVCRLSICCVFVSKDQC